MSVTHKESTIPFSQGVEDVCSLNCESSGTRYTHQHSQYGGNVAVLAVESPAGVHILRQSHYGSVGSTQFL